MKISLVQKVNCWSWSLYSVTKKHLNFVFLMNSWSVCGKKKMWSIIAYHICQQI